MKWYQPVKYKYKSFNIWLNDDNIKPEWVEHPAKFTEIHSRSGNKDLFLNIGESWTYGESIRDIKTGLQEYSLHTMLDCTFGPKISKSLNADFYQYAVPGNCNGYMIKELERILKYINDNFDYRNIYLAIQFTEPSRELAALGNLPEHPIRDMYYGKTKRDFKQWLKDYDDLFLGIIQDTVAPYENVKPLVWKNFCSFQNTKSYPNINLIQENWIQFSARQLNVEYEPLVFQSVGWFNDMYSNQRLYAITFDFNWCQTEIDKIEKSNKFISGNELHNNHPNEHAHMLWANRLLEQSGWINV